MLEGLEAPAVGLVGRVERGVAEGEKGRLLPTFLVSMYSVPSIGCNLIIWCTFRHFFHLFHQFRSLISLFFKGFL